MSGGSNPAGTILASLTCEEIAAATGALVSGERADVRFATASIDSRQTRPGALFFALRGPNRDGHDFLPAAIEAGAAGIVVSRSDRIEAGCAGAVRGNLVRFRVRDTTRALQDLAAHARSRLSLVVGITGSAGKTSAKEMTAAVLSGRRTTGCTAGNLNNLYGLPLTLLNLSREATAAVLEMGMSYPGEIARLVEIAEPDVGVILNIGEAHLGNFPSIEGIAEAKGELFAGMRPTAIAVWNAADARVRRLAERYKGPKLSFATGAPADLVAQDIDDDILRGVRFRLRAEGRDLPVRLVAFGRHNVQNALAALAVAKTQGNDMERAVSALALTRASRGRGEVHRLSRGIVLVDETYNSNPSAVASVLASLAETDWAGRKVFVTGDMLELGPQAAEYHRQVGEQAARAGVGLLFAVGPMAAETAAGAERLGLPAVLARPDADAAAALAEETLAAGDLVVVKGSRAIGMECFVAAALKAFGAAGATNSTGARC